MGQTILDEYLANIEEDDDNNLPDPKPFGFSSIATMLSEAVEVMEQQAESNRELRRKLDKAEQLAATRNEDIGRLQGELKQAMARIAELEAPAKHGGPVTDEFDPNLLMVHLNHPCYELDSFYAGSQADADAARGQGYVSLAELRKIQPAAE